MLDIFKNYTQLKFVKLKGHSKSPYETNWQNKPYNFVDIKEHFSEHNNYGVLAGYGDLIIIDCDKVTSASDKNQRFPEFDHELASIIKKRLPETLTITSGSGANHFYFFCKGLHKKVVLKSMRNNNYVHWGEIMSKGTQVVGPGSIHPETKRKYKISKQAPIAEISIIQLYNVLRHFIPALEKKSDYGATETPQGIDSLNVTDIFGTAGLKTHNGQYVGAHPVHGSTNGSNFWLDPHKNTWYCFRCESGGGPAAAIAVKEGIINCSDAGRGSLHGDTFKEVLTAAREKYGLKDQKPQKQNADKFEDIQEEHDKLKLNLWTFKDFEDFEIDTSFLVDKILYPKTVSMLYSPPGEFKSIMAVYLALAIAQGKPWCGYESQQNGVLYCDKENNDRIIKERLMALYKGQEYQDKEMPLWFLRREGDLIKNKKADEKFIEKLFYNIEANNIKVVFFDTMHRFGDYDENSSDDVNLLYTQIFQPLIEKYGCSVIFLHHTNKDGNFRGSGDFLGMVDTAYTFKRIKNGQKKSNMVRIINEKNRSGEVEEMKVELMFHNREEEGNEILDSIEIIEQENQENQQGDQEFYSQVKNTIKQGELKYKRDIMAILQNQGLTFSESKLKRTLKWMLDKNIFVRDHMNRYKLVVENMDYEKEAIMEDLTND